MNEGEGEGEGDDTIGEYEGERNQNKQRHGKGRALLPNLDYYEGSYKEGLREGEGHYVFKGGAQYKGHYKEGMKHGSGVFYYPDGSAYEGEWKEDKRDGKGKYTYAQGDTYVGDWEKDERHGMGTYTYKTSGVVMFGVWEKGKMEGSGMIKYPTFTFHGKFLHNMPIGRGCFVFTNYCIQQGHYVHVRDETAVPTGVEGEHVAGEEDEEKMSPREGYPKGITPLWRPRKILPYLTELIPPDPKLPPKPPASEPPENDEPREEVEQEGEQDGDDIGPEEADYVKQSLTENEFNAVQEDPNILNRSDAPIVEERSPEQTDNTDEE